jgi:hypothetical protein
MRAPHRCPRRVRVFRGNGGRGCEGVSVRERPRALGYGDAHAELDMGLVHARPAVPAMRRRKFGNGWSQISQIMLGLDSEAPARTRSPAQAAAASNCGRRRSAASNGARLGLRVGAPPCPDLSRSPSCGATHLRSVAPLADTRSWPIGSAQRRALGAAQSLSRSRLGGAPEALGARSSQLQSGRPHARPPHSGSAYYRGLLRFASSRPFHQTALSGL